MTFFWNTLHWQPCSVSTTLLVLCRDGEMWVKHPYLIILIMVSSPHQRWAWWRDPLPLPGEGPLPHHLATQHLLACIARSVRKVRCVRFRGTEGTIPQNKKMKINKNENENWNQNGLSDSFFLCLLFVCLFVCMWIPGSVNRVNCQAGLRGPHAVGRGDHGGPRLGGHHRTCWALKSDHLSK